MKLSVLNEEKKTLAARYKTKSLILGTVLPIVPTNLLLQPLQSQISDPLSYL